MRLIGILSCAAVAMALASAQAMAGLWDWDTQILAKNEVDLVVTTEAPSDDENGQSGSVYLGDLLTGRFPRHSRTFYYWRIRDRLNRLEQHPDAPSLYDDLAVAYEKLDEHDKAIETIFKKKEIAPGLFETYANLGTFYMHRGELQKSLESVEKAIQINAEAPFGREIYQKYLVEYMLEKSAPGRATLPLSSIERSAGAVTGFAQFVLDKQSPSEEGATAELQRATKGIATMLRFGNLNSPILLEALGDVLLAQNDPELQSFAVRAYLKASYYATGSDAVTAYRGMARAALGSPSAESHDALAKEETEFEQDLLGAVRSYALAIRIESRAIERSRNPEGAFAEAFYDLTDEGDSDFRKVDYSKAWVLGLIPVAPLLGMLFFSVVDRLKRKDRTPADEFKDGG